MQAESQVTSPNNISLFAWVKVIKKKFITSFPEIKTTALLLLHENISKEFEKILAKQNRTRARAFYEILRELYLHLYWKIDGNIECHIKSTCVLILYYMSYTGLILSKGNVSSKWFSQTFRAFHFLSGDPFLVCDALLLFQNMKKKYHYAYSEILKTWLFDGYLRKPSDYESFVKIMLLFRRLKSLSKEAETRSKIMFYALKVQCPPGIESWLSSLKIKDLCNIKSNKIIQKFLKKDLSCHAVKKLQKILFANKYDARFINSHRKASIQQSTYKTKKIEKKFNKKSDKVKAKSNTVTYEHEIDLNNTIKSKNSKNHSDYQCVSPAKISLNEKNSTYVSALSENSACPLTMPKGKFSEKEEIGKTCLVSVSSKSGKKIYTNNKMNEECKKSNPKHSIQLNGRISDHSATDSVKEVRVKGENIIPVLIVDSKHASKEAGKQIYGDTSKQFFMCFSKSDDLQSYHIENESLVSCNIEEEKPKSDNLSLSIEPCKLKRNITENCSEDGNDLKFATPITFRKDGALDILRTNKHCENSLAMPDTEKSLIINSFSGTDLEKNNIDFSATDRSNLLSFELLGQEIMQTAISENNVTNVHKNNLEILTKNDHIPPKDFHIENRLLTVLPKILNKEESDCEKKSVNYPFCVNNTKLVTSNHPQATVTQSKEVQNSAESPIIISPLKSHINQGTPGNCFELYIAENLRNQDTRLVSMLSSPFKKSSSTMYSSPESLELSIVSCPSASFSIEKSLELSKSIYSTTDSSLTTEDELHMLEKKGSPTKLFQLNSKAITSKMSKSKLSTKKSRKRVKSRKYIESSCSSANESSLKLETPKTISNSNCEGERFSDVLESKTNDESSNKISSLLLSNKKEIITDSTKHKVDHSEKRKQVLQFTSKCEIDLSSNHLVEEENKMPCLEYIDVPNPSEINDKSSELQTEKSKSLSTVGGNITQIMHLPELLFAANEGGSMLPADNSTKNPYPVCTFETVNLLHSTSKNELQHCLSELNNLPSHKSVHEQLEDSRGIHQNVSSPRTKLLESISDNKFDFANGLRTSSPVHAKKSFNDVPNSNKINSNFPPLQNEQFSRDCENDIVKVNNSEMPLNNSLAVILNQGLLPEVQDVQIVLTDSLVPQSYPVSPSSKFMIKNLDSPGKEKNASFDSTSKLKKIGRRKKRKFVSDSDSDALENQKSMEAKCISRSNFKKSIDLSKEQKFPCKTKYKKCFVDSDSDASIHENGLHDSTASQESPSQKEIKNKDIILESASQDNSDHLELPLIKSKEQKLSTKGKYKRCLTYSDSDASIHENGLHDSTVSQESRSQKEIKHKDKILESASQDNPDHSELPLTKSKVQKIPTKGKYKRCLTYSDSDASLHENGLHDSTVSPESPSQKEIKHNDIIGSASEDNSDHSELSSNCSSQKLNYNKVNPKYFISEYASEDNDYHSECSSEILSSEVSHNSFIVNSATEDDSDSDRSTCLSSSSQLRSFENDDAKNVTIETETQENVRDLMSLSRSPSPELRPSKKVKYRASYFDSSSEDDADKSVSSLKCLSPKLKPSYKVKSKRYVLESESEDNANESVIPSKNLFSDFIPSSKIKSKSVVLKSASEDSADDSVVFSRSQSLEFKHLKVKSQVLDSTKNNTNLISSPSSHLPLLETNSIAALNTGFSSSRVLNASPLKQKSKYLLRSSSIKEEHKKSFSETKKSMKANKFKEIDSNSKNSLVNSSSRMIRKSSGTKELDENCIFPFNKRSRRRSKKIVSESESDSGDNQYDHESKSDHSQNISSKNLAASYNHLTNPSGNSNLNHLTNPSGNSNLNTNFVQINCRTKLVSSVKRKKNLDVSKIHVDSSTNQTFSTVHNKSNVLRNETSNYKCVQRELSFESESSSEDIPLIEIQKKLKTSVKSLVSPGNPNSFINLDKSLLKVSSDSIQNSEKDSFVLKHSPLPETCSVHEKENLELSKTSQNSAFISAKGRQEVSLKEASLESTSDLLRDEIKKKNSELVCSVYQKENFGLSKTSQNSAFISDKEQKVSLKEASSELASDLLGNEIKKKSSQFVQTYQTVLEFQQNLQLQSTKENLPTLNQLKNSVVGSHLEQSYVNNLNVSSSEKGNMFPKTLSNLNNLPSSKQENNSSPREKDGCTGHQLSEIDKNMCDLFLSEKEHLSRDLFHDTNYLSDENFVQTLFDKIDPNILNNEDYLSTFVDNYLISSSTQTAFNESIENSNCLSSVNTNGSHFNSAIPYSDTLVNKFNQQNSEPIFSSATPYSNTVNKSDQQNSEPIISSATHYSNTLNKSELQDSESIFSPLNNETFDFQVREGNVINSKIVEFDAVDVQNICLNSNLDPNQILEENNSQQSLVRYGNSYNTTELKQLDLGITPTEEVNVTKRSDILIKQNPDSLCNLASLIKISTNSTNCEQNKEIVKPPFHEMDFGETSPDRLNISLNSKTLLEEHQKDVSYSSKLKILSQDHSSNFRVNPVLNTSEKLQIMQACLNNTADTNEKILFICDIENKTCQVHIMPQQLMVTFLSKMGNVSQNHILCSNSTKCNCPLCCYSSSTEFKDEELSKDSNNTRTEMGHICVNGVKLLTSSLFPVVNLGKRCDEEIKQNSSKEKDSAISLSNKVSDRKQISVKKRCLVKSNSKSIVPENRQRTVQETRRNSFCKKENKSTVLKKESIPKKSYNLRTKKKK